MTSASAAAEKYQIMAQIVIFLYKWEWRLTIAPDSYLWRPKFLPACRFFFSYESKMIAYERMEKLNVWLNYANAWNLLTQ